MKHNTVVINVNTCKQDANTEGIGLVKMHYYFAVQSSYSFLTISTSYYEFEVI